MEQRDGRLVAGRLEVEEELGQLGAREQRFVHDRAARERADEERRQLGSRLGDAGVDRVARQVQRTLPGGVVGPPPAGGRGDEGVTQGRAGGVRGRPEDRGVHRDLAPTKDGEPLLPQHVLDDRRGAGERARLAWQEEGAHGERLPGLQVQPQSRRFLIEEGVGDLGEEPGAVSGVVGRGGAAMRHAGHRLERQCQDVVGRLSRRPRHEPHAASVLGPPRIELARAPARSVRSACPLCHAAPPLPRVQRSTKRKARSLGAGRGFSLAWLHAYAARSLPLWGLAGMSLTVFCGSGWYTVSGAILTYASGRMNMQLAA